MSKELEALKRIKREAGTPYFSGLYDIDMWKEDFATIEKALKEKEQQEHYIEVLKDSLNNAETTATRYIKAVKLLKEKLSPLARYTFFPMTAEEYEIIKEMFL